MKTPLKLTAISLAMGLAACSSVKDAPESTQQPVVNVVKQKVDQTIQTETLVELREEERDLTDGDVLAEPLTAVVAKPSAVKEVKTEISKLARSKKLHAEATYGASSQIAHFQPIAPPPQALDRENYHHFKDNPLKFVANEPVSTFSIDVDTGSYSNIRRFLNQGQLPRQDAVRVEELINYFNYSYQPPKTESVPFAVYTELAPSPWNVNSKLLHIGLKGYEVPRDNLPPANLVFLIDVSGSMNSPDKLGLLKQGFRLLTNQLRAKDTISIAVYAGASGVVLEPTTGDQKHKILSAIDQLRAGGSTNGAAGINLAYQLANANHHKKGINRVILATDGDFNVGTVNFEALTDLVEKKRQSGIALTTLGFGTGNYNDHLMEQLADKGNGNYAYIDNLQEARKVLVEELGSTLQSIAKDVKIQVEFNPNVVASYRLIGYENRALKREDFNNDKVDAGEIGAGHTVTAIYELEYKGQETKVDPLRYAKEKVSMEKSESDFQNEVAFLKLRYKQPNQDNSQLIKTPILIQDQLVEFSQASNQFKFSTAVAAFGQLLRGGQYIGEFDYQDVVSLGLEGKGSDQWGYRSEFINLVRLAKELDR